VDEHHVGADGSLANESDPIRRLSAAVELSLVVSTTTMREEKGDVLELPLNGVLQIYRTKSHLPTSERGTSSPPPVPVPAPTYSLLPGSQGCAWGLRPSLRVPTRFHIWATTRLTERGTVRGCTSRPLDLRLVDCPSRGTAGSQIRNYHPTISFLLPSPQTRYSPEAVREPPLPVEQTTLPQWLEQV
jgi:hypothetical protein